MEKYIVKKLDKNDEEEFNEFIFEHVVNDEEVLVCDNSLISKKPYIKYSSFNNWYEVNKMIDQYRFMHERVKASTYLLYRSIDERNRLVAVFEVRHNLTPNTEKYGNISINIRPSERGKGYYSKCIRCALTVAKELNLDKIKLVVNKNDLKSVKAIQKFNDEAVINETEEDYTYTFYNKKVKEQIEEEYLDKENSALRYLCINKLYDDKINKGVIGYDNIYTALESYFEAEKPFGYLYVLDSECFKRNHENSDELVNDSEPYDIIKVTYDQFIELQEKKKLVK